MSAQCRKSNLLKCPSHQGSSICQLLLSSELNKPLSCWNSVVSSTFVHALKHAWRIWVASFRDFSTGSKGVCNEKRKASSLCFNTLSSIPWSVSNTVLQQIKGSYQDVQLIFGSECTRRLGSCWDACLNEAPLGIQRAGCGEREPSKHWSLVSLGVLFHCLSLQHRVGRQRTSLGWLSNDTLQYDSSFIALPWSIIQHDMEHVPSWWIMFLVLPCDVRAGSETILTEHFRKTRTVIQLSWQQADCPPSIHMGGGPCFTGKALICPLRLCLIDKSS